MPSCVSINRASKSHLNDEFDWKFINLCLYYDRTYVVNSILYYIFYFHASGFDILLNSNLPGSNIMYIIISVVSNFHNWNGETEAI